MTIDDETRSFAEARPGTEEASPENRMAEAPRPRSPWVSVLVILVGSYAAVLNITVVGVALPSVAESFGGNEAWVSVDWVVTSFLVGVVLVLPLTGWLSDRFGRKAMYVASLTSFGVGAVMCAAAPNMVVLVIGRLIQGFGGGVLMPVGMTMVYELFPPHRRGTAMGIWGVGIMAAPAAGPPLGGWLVTVGSWRWVFGVFVVFAALAAALALRWLPEIGHREHRRLDPIGWVLMAIAVVALVIGSREATEWGYDAPVTWAVVTLAVAALGLVGWRSLRRTDPIIDLGMFSVPTFRMAMIVVAFMSIGQFAQLTFLPMELQVVRDLDAQRVGLLLMPGAIGVAAMMPIAGWLADRVGGRLPASIGLVINAVTMWRLGHLQPDGSERQIVEILLVQGIGMGLVFMPTTVSAMNSLPARFVGQAAAVNNLVRQLGAAIGTAMLSAVVVASVGDVTPVGLPADESQAAYNRVFLTAFWFTVIAAIAAMVGLPGKAQAARHREERATEQEVHGAAD